MDDEYETEKMQGMTYWSWFKSEVEHLLWIFGIKNYHDFCDEIYYSLPWVAEKRHGRKCGGCQPLRMESK